MIGGVTLHGLLGQKIGEVLPKAVNGYLYNWYAASDANFFPSSIHLPSESEFDTLATFLLGASVAGGKMKESGFTFFNSPNTDADNSSGFTGYGSGIRSSSGSFASLLENGVYAVSNDLTTLTRYTRLRFNDAILFAGNAFKYWGLSVRGVTTTNPGSTVMDYEGRIYDIIQIGTQYWTVQNWACKYLNNGTLIPNVTDNLAWTALTTLGRCAYGNDENYV